MINEQITAKQVCETALGGAHAPVVFLAIATPKRFLIEHANGMDCRPLHVHAKADGRWNFDESAVIDPTENYVECGDRQVCWQFV